MAATGPVDALVLEPETSEFSAPVLLCPLLILPVGEALWVAAITPLRPAWDRPLLAALAAALDEVLPLFERFGEDVEAAVVLLPELPVVKADTEQLTWRSI